jgi:hypothetical protein
MGITTERALTCFCDARATLLRPDMLAHMERNSSLTGSGPPEGKATEDSSVSKDESGRSGQLHFRAVECVPASEYSMIPYDTNGLDLSSLDQLHLWDGFCTFLDCHVDDFSSSLCFICLLHG